MHQPAGDQRTELLLEAPPHEQQRHQHAHADQLERTGSASLRAAQFAPRTQTFLLEGMFDRFAAIGLRPLRGRREERQLRHHAHSGRKMVEHPQDAKQGISALLQQFAFAPSAQGQVRRSARAQFGG